MTYQYGTIVVPTSANPYRYGTDVVPTSTAAHSVTDRQPYTDTHIDIYIYLAYYA